MIQHLTDTNHFHIQFLRWSAGGPQTTTTHHNRFTTRLPGPPRWAGARRELLDFMVQRKINTGRHTDHLAGRHSIRTKQCAPPPSPHAYYRPDATLTHSQRCQINESIWWINDESAKLKTRSKKRQIITTELPVSAAAGLSARPRCQLLLNADVLSHVNCQHFGLLSFYPDLADSNKGE